MVPRAWAGPGTKRAHIEHLLIKAMGKNSRQPGKNNPLCQIRDPECRAGKVWTKKKQCFSLLPHLEVSVSTYWPQFTHL